LKLTDGAMRQHAAHAGPTPPPPRKAHQGMPGRSRVDGSN